MPSSASPSLRLEEQFTGENINIWGILLNQVIAMLDAAIAGMATIALTGNYSLTSSNYVADEARNAILKFTGSVACNVTVPAVTKIYIIWNATSAVQTIYSAGGGSTVSIDAGDIVLVFCDAVNMKELGFGGVGLKAYITSVAAGGPYGNVPAVASQNGKWLTNNGTIPLWALLNSTDLGDYATRIVGVQVALAVSL